MGIMCAPFEYDERMTLFPESTGQEYSLSPCGSAVHVAAEVSRLGIESYLIGKIGTDSMGVQIQAGLAHTDIKPRLILSPAHHTNIAVFYVKQHGYIRTAVGTANQSLTASEILDTARDLLPSLRYLYLGSCLKLDSLLPHIAMIVAEMRRQGIILICDPGHVPHTASQQQLEMVRILAGQSDYYLHNKDDFTFLWDSLTVEEAIVKVRSVSDCSIVIKNAPYHCLGVKGLQTYRISQQIQSQHFAFYSDRFNAGFIHALDANRHFRDCMRAGLESTRSEHRNPPL